MVASSKDEMQSAWQMIGTRLRHMRLHHNLTLDEAAATIGASIAKISRMERGLAPLRRRDLIDLLALYSITDPAQREVLISVAVGERSPSWWDDHTVPLETTVIWSHEQAADLIRTYDPFLVPELLQTEDYARSAHLARHYPSPPSDATEGGVKNLIRRQQARHATLWAVIDEPVLWRPLDDLDTHLRQLDALADASHTRDVTIQIVPLKSPCLPSAAPFTIYQLPNKDIVTLHHHTGDETTDLANAEQWGLLFDQLTGVASRRAETPQILARIRKHLSGASL